MNAREVHTYTILLTIIALGDKAPTRGVLQDHIEQALEEGTDRHAPYHLAVATALDGNQLDTRSQRIERISKLHESLNDHQPETPPRVSVTAAEVRAYRDEHQISLAEAKERVYKLKREDQQ